MGGGETPGAVQLSFTYTEDEYISAARFFFSRAHDAKFRFYLFLGFLAGALLIAWLSGDVYVAATILIPVLLVLARYWYAYSTLPRSYFRRNPKFRDPYELTFSDGGIVFRSKGVESRLEWGFYTKVLETPEHFFLVYGKDMFSLIPKRAFRDPRQESVFREMLRRKLGAGVETAGLPAAESRSIEREYVPPREPPDWR
jgi:hypothetical protein